MRSPKRCWRRRRRSATRPAPPRLPPLLRETSRSDSWGGGGGSDKGFISAYFITDFDAQEAVLEDALVLLHREKISSLPDLLPLLEKVAESGKPLLIIAAA